MTGHIVAAAIAACLVLAACGGDDDGIDYDDSSPWMTTISPTGQKIECISLGSWGWCRDVKETP